MRTRWTNWLAGSLWILTLIFIVCVLIVMYANERISSLFLDGTGVFALGVCTLATVGVILAIHRPGNPIGWIFLVAALSQVVVGTSDEYAIYIIKTAPGTLPKLTLLFWVGSWAWVLSFLLPTTFGILLFPTGRLPSQRWRPFAWCVASCLTIFVVAEMFNPQLQDIDADHPAFSNPVGIQALGDTFEYVLTGFTILVWPVLLIGSVLSIFARFRQATGRERQQIKWFAFAAAIPIVGLVIELVLFSFTHTGIGIPFYILGIAILPVAIGIAILRYNLYDIDRIINRSLVYGSLTVLLLLSFIGSVILFQFLLDPVTGGNDLAVAGSTLLIAALFRPIRNSVQHFVDRRFYRRKYDARQLLRSFSVTARDAVQLDQLTGGLTDIVTRTMQPEHISIWLRPEQEGRS